MNTLGERLGRPKERFVPGTPVTRKLRYSRLARTDGEDILSTSRSAPTLPPHPRRILHDQLRLEGQQHARLAAEHTSSNKDALDLALQLQTPSKSSKQPAQVPDNEDAKLRQHCQQLEEELLHVTKKLNRKYTKALFPPRTPSPSKIHDLAAKWSQDQQSSQALTEDERYAMYMEGRYATQTQMDFYARDAEVRDSTTNKHRHNAMHTKYGNALVMNKNSLRGKF